MYDDDNLAKEYVEESKLPEYPVSQIPDFDDFDGENLETGIMPQESCHRDLQM